VTYSLLGGLVELKAEADRNREVWEREWMDYATKRVPRLQIEEMKQRWAEIAFVADDNHTAVLERGRVQRPRVFYSRETAPRPFLIARP
jgi:hypothetical protein